MISFFNYLFFYRIVYTVLFLINMPEKVLEVMLGPWTNVLLLLAAVAAVWLLLRDLGVGMSVSKAGFNASSTYGIGSNLALIGGGIQEVGLGIPNQPSLIIGVDGGSKSGFASRKRRDGMGDNEYPVFWNPGSYIDVNKLQNDQIGQEGVDMNNGTSAQPDGFLGDRNPPPYLMPQAGFASGGDIAARLTSPY